jgi:hypothetical protein
MNTLDAIKLTPSAYLRDAMEIARSTVERLTALRRELEGTRPGLDESRAALRRMIAAARSPNFSRPPQELRRLNYLLTGDALAELATLGSSSFELFALAVQIASEQHPENFGSCESSQDYDRRLLELAMRRDELNSRIATEFTVEDLLIGDPDARGMAQVTFRLSGGAVPLGPKANAGERLVNWLLDHGV